MSRFLDPLKVVLLTPAAAEYRGHWALKAKLRYQSDLLGRIVAVPRGFVTDMESCPRLPVVFLAFGEVSKMAAVIHDYLYTHPTTVTRSEADAVLREACIVEGVSKWRAYGIWLGVRIGGSGSFGEAAK
jgi:hypothetical protein